jgi:hypothetical protein
MSPSNRNLARTIACFIGFLISTNAYAINCRKGDKSISVEEGSMSDVWLLKVRGIPFPGIGSAWKFQGGEQVQRKHSSGYYFNIKGYRIEITVQEHGEEMGRTWLTILKGKKEISSTEFSPAECGNN